ncbi:collectin-11 [Biomphalaria pfeifferi]|uniref:Collectin-11 n=1 Tax=Biomphalaria pfeifferi TaxID=112525 RepID=A0AAD8BNY0_BIOPF|nr:collectin-11 [Biomphalaria pfeifferi]
MTHKENALLTLVTLLSWSFLYAALICRGTPTALEVGVSLQLECLFTPDSTSNVTYPSSVKLLHSNSTTNPSYIDLLTVVNVDNIVGDLSNSPNIKVYGTIGNTKLSYLRISWESPKLENAGAYRCVTYGVDKKGNPQFDLSETTVSVKNPNDKCQGNDAKNTTESTKSKGVKQDLLTKAQNSMFTTSPEFKGSRYLLPKTKGSKNFLDSILTCGQLGGYFAEIDSKEEYNFVLNSLLSSSTYQIVYISGTDEGKEGVWVHSFSKTNLTFFKWAKGEPNLGKRENCMAYHKKLLWLFVDIDCTKLLTFDGTVSFVCEVPE